MSPAPGRSGLRAGIWERGARVRGKVGPAALGTTPSGEGRVDVVAGKGTCRIKRRPGGSHRNEVPPPPCREFRGGR